MEDGFFIARKRVGMEPAEAAVAAVPAVAAAAAVEVMEAMKKQQKKRCFTEKVKCHGKFYRLHVLYGSYFNNNLYWGNAGF